MFCSLLRGFQEREGVSRAVCSNEKTQEDWRLWTNHAVFSEREREDVRPTCCISPTPRRRCATFTKNDSHCRS